MATFIKAIVLFVPSSSLPAATNPDINSQENSKPHRAARPAKSVLRAGVSQPPRNQGVNVPILPKASSKRLLGPNFVNHSVEPEHHTPAPLVDFRCEHNSTVGTILRNPEPPIIVFGWEIEGIHSSDIDHLASALPHTSARGKAQ
jgi:hypothetical protein